MRKVLFTTLILLLTASLAFAGLEDRFSDITLKRKPSNYIQFPEISAPSGNPATNYGWLYVKDNGGTTDLYFEDDGGTVTELTSASSTAYSGLANPTSDKTITFDDNEITVWTFADTNEDMFNIQGLGAFGDVSIVRIEQKTGNPTDGTVLEVVSADANVDPLVVSANGVANALVVGQDGTTTISTLVATSWTVTTFSIGGASTFEGNINIDDGSGASPSLTFTDESNETAVFSKADSGNLSMTIAAADSLIVTTGNLRVGDGTPGTAAMDGEDFYVNGDSEFDGAVQLDGAVTSASTFANSGGATFSSTVALSENVTFTVAADEYFKIDADTTANTTTAGVLDINVQSATNGNIAQSITYQLEDNATTAYAIKIDVDDDATGGETIYGLYFGNSAGTSSTTIGIGIANTADTGISAVNGAAATTISVDATTTASTSTTGAILDASFRTATSTGQAMNLDVECDVAGGASEECEGLHIQLDDDSNTATDEVHGIDIDGDGAGTGLSIGVYIGDTASGIDIAFKAANGYLWMGDTGTPDQTPGDDDVYVEGTVEIDGNLYPDGNIVGDGGTIVSGMLRDTEVVAAANNDVAVAESGITYFLNAAGGFQTTLPAPAAGLVYRFVIKTAPAGGNYTVITNGTANVLYGLVVVNGATVQGAAEDTITFANGNAAIGDWAEVESDGTNWYVSGQGAAAGAITLTQAD